MSAGSAAGSGDRLVWLALLGFSDMLQGAFGALSDSNSPTNSLSQHKDHVQCGCLSSCPIPGA